MNYMEEVEIEIHGVTVKTNVMLVKHEYYSTDNATSKYWYEKF